MAGLGELERLTDEESADVSGRVERFRAAWQADGTTALELFLPPRGARHRLAVLVQLVLVDMERRAQARLPFEVESYLAAYSDDFSAGRVSVEIIVAEYRLRHRHGDKPPVVEYRLRFPNQYEEFASELAQNPPGLGEHTPAAPIHPVGERPSSAPRKSTVVGRRPDIAPPISPIKSDDLPGTGPVNFLETPRPGEGSTILPTDTPYQLLRKLGSGAFGEVYEALAPGGVRVAIKRILRTVDHPASKSERGALDAIKELSHPFLLKTNAYWVFGDRLVIVMELADGSLGDRIEHHVSQGRTGVPTEELVPLFEQAAEALDYLHSQNVSHRDIKPENVLILKGYAKVADFGLARIHEHTMTVVNNTVGTPAYMAPEMWKQKVSLQSDQYSLAATYVRARLNRNLFTTNVLVDLANFHINETPNLDPLPASEQKVLLKALAKDPHDRYRSCAEFAKALRAAAMPAPEPPAPRPVQPPANGSTLWRTLSVALTCALVAGAAIFLTRKQEEPPKDTTADKKDDKGKDAPPVVIVQSEKRYATYPDYWQPSEKAGTHVIGDKHYHRVLTRMVGDQELVAHLIFPTAASHPEPFYMLEHKVTNKVFNIAWGRIANSATVKEVRAKDQRWVPSAWQKDEDGTLLDIDGKDADLPVLAVTVLEAVLVAEELGGSLPNLDQWLKATGVLEGNPIYGPAGSPLGKPPDTLRGVTEIYSWKSEQFKARKVALGIKERPLPVHSELAVGDVSRWKIRQLVSNGQEWLGQATDDPMTRLTVRSLLIRDREVIVVGSAPRDTDIKLPGALKNEFNRQSGDAVKGDGISGFRVMFEPR